MNDNETIRTGTKKVVITVFTQAVILALSFITGFILPKIMGPITNMPLPLRLLQRFWLLL